MSDSTITLSTEIVVRLEMLAEQEGRNLNELFTDLLQQYQPAPSNKQWAAKLVTHMENAAIDWLDEADLSAHSATNYADASYQTWLKTQDDSSE